MNRHQILVRKHLRLIKHHDSHLEATGPYNNPNNRQTSQDDPLEEMLVGVEEKPDFARAGLDIQAYLTPQGRKLVRQLKRIQYYLEENSLDEEEKLR